MKVTLIPPCIAVALLLSLGACTLFVPHIHDLELVSVQAVPARILPDGKPHDSGPQLKITVATRFDFVDLAQGNHFIDLFVRPEISACTDGDFDENKKTSVDYEVYWEGGAVNGMNTFYPDPDFRSKRDALYPAFRDRGRKEYAIFSNIRYVRRWPDDPMPTFDLEKSPEDLCLFVRGGNMAGFFYRSNTVVIPKAAVIEALRQARTGGS